MWVHHVLERPVLEVDGAVRRPTMDITAEVVVDVCFVALLAAYSETCEINNAVPN